MNDIDMVDFCYRDMRFFFEPESGGVYQENPLLREILHLARQNNGSEKSAEILRLLSRNHPVDKIIPLLRQCYEHKILPLPKLETGPASSVRETVPLTEMFLQVCHRCNLACRYCYANGGGFGGNGGDMDPDTAKNAVDFLFAGSGSQSPCIINFDGGEPFLNFPLVRSAVEYAEDKAVKLGKKVSFNISTNGTLFSPENVAFMAQHQIGIGVSIDGDELAHNHARTFKNGKGSYRRLLKRMKETGIFEYPEPVHARATITRATLNCFDTVRHLYDLGFRVIYLEPAAAASNASDTSIPGNGWAVDAEGLEKVKLEFQKIAQFYKTILLSGERVIFRNFYQPLKKIHGKSRSLTRCAAGTGMVAVAPDGGLFPCYKFAGHKGLHMGNVNQGTFLMERSRHFRDNRVDRKEECNRCWARYLCGGGCAYLGEARCGDIRANDPLDCGFTRHLIRLSLEMYVAVANENPEVWKQLLG